MDSSESKEEVKMKILGRGKGIFGLKKRLNGLFLTDIIILITGILYSIAFENWIFFTGTLGIFFVILSYLMLLSGARRN